jgi:hypothetical protein
MYHTIDLVLCLCRSKLAALGEHARQIFTLHFEFLTGSFLPSSFPCSAQGTYGEARNSANQTAKPVQNISLSSIRTRWRIN